MNLILVSFLIERQSFAGDGRVHRRPEVSVLLDDIPLESFDLYILPCLVHLPEHLDPLPLYLGERPLLILGLLEPDLLSPLRVLLLRLLLPLDQRALQQVQSVILVLLDLVLPLLPVTHLLLLHQLASQAERSLVRGRRQSVQESSLVAHLADKLHLGLAGGEPSSKDQVLDTQHFGDAVGMVFNILGGVGVRLGLRFTEDSLNFNRFSFRFILFNFSRDNALFWN